MASHNSDGNAENFDPRQMQAMLGAMAANMNMNMGMGMGGMEGMGGMGGPDAGLGSNLDPMQMMQMMQMMQYFQNMQRGEGGFQGMGGMPPFGGMPGFGMPMGGGMKNDPPTQIRVAVEGMKFQYQLTEDDLHKVFSRYGRVKVIKVDEVGSGAQITFHNNQDASAAMQDLDGKVLNGLDGTLRISWMNNPVENQPPYSANAGMPPPFPGGWGFPGVPPWPQGNQNHGNQHQMEPTTPEQGRRGRFELGEVDGKGVRKYTCRFLIGIENDKEFQVARRIIGAKGANMKKVVKNTEAKLRLRGAGSGYFEGAGQKESAEPLQLCISCTNYDGYKAAVSQVEELINRTYDEYRQFCRENGKPVPDLRINMSENQLVYSNKQAPYGESPYGDNAGSMTPRKQGKNTRTNKSNAKNKLMGGQEVDRGEPGPNAPSVEEIEKLVDQRNEARRAGNFAEADRVRALLHSNGVALMDEPGGRGKGSEVTVWRYWRD